MVKKEKALQGRIMKGDKVRFSHLKIAPYEEMYGVTEDDLLVVEHVEERGGAKRALYLSKPGRVAWIPAYPGALRLIQRRKPAA